VPITVVIVFGRAAADTRCRVAVSVGHTLMGTSTWAGSSASQPTPALSLRSGARRRDGGRLTRV
jgi:hypothetical protein